MSLIYLNRLVFGSIAIIIGIAFWFAAPKQVSVAGEPITFTSTWEIVDNLLARRTLNGNNFDEIVIGVATWKVTGNFGSEGPYFKEVWESPSDPPTFDCENDDPNKCKMTGGLTGNWIAGALWPDNLSGLQKIEVFKNRFDRDVHNDDGSDARIDGVIGSCGSAGDECMFTTGAYGFTNYHNYSQAGSGKDKTNAVAMPVRWTVTGKICELQSDTACK